MKLTDLFETVIPRIRHDLFEADVGREYQHLEDLLITNGASGGIEALSELRLISRNPSSLNMKWDGMAAVFWGRDESGQFFFSPLNQWTKGQKLDRDGLASEIRNTGRPKPDQSQEQFAKSRSELGSKYQRLWDIFERATPKDFRGYLNGDLMFTEKQSPTPEGYYEFTPNKVTYRVNKNGLFGKMPTASVFVAVHGKIDTFGSPATGNLKRVTDDVISAFNKTADLIALPIQTPAVELNQVDSEITQGMKFVSDHALAIDTVSNFTAPKMSTFKKILYDYAVKLAKSNGTLDFNQWLESSKVSENQRNIINEFTKSHKNEWKAFWQAFNIVRDVKHDVLEDLNTKHGKDMASRLGIMAITGGKPGGEGFVKSTASGGMAKLVNPRFRSAPDNPRFSPNISESSDKGNKDVVWAFGRMNPPHWGHGGLIRTLQTEAAKRGGDWKLFVSSKNEPKKNPLTYEQKVGWLLKLYPDLKDHLVVDPNIKTPLVAATWLYGKGYRSSAFVAGEDDMPVYGKMIQSGNMHGIQNPDLLPQGKGFVFEPLDLVVSDRLSSATDVRKTVSAGDRKAFAKAVLGPDMANADRNLIKSIENDMFDEVKRGMDQ